MYTINKLILTKHMTLIYLMTLKSQHIAGDTAGVVGDNVDNAYVSVSHNS